MSESALIPFEDQTVATREDSSVNNNPGRRYNIGTDRVNKATEALPDDQRSALRWLHNYLAEQNMSTHDVAPFLKRNGKPYDGNTIYQALIGTRDSSLKNVAEAIAAFRQLEEERVSITRAPFIETSLTKKIFAVCKKALHRQRVCFIFGEIQIGKTAALEEYTRRNNHGQTVMVRMPAGGKFRAFLEEVAISLRISPQQSPNEIRRRVVRSFDSRMVLIVDEMHQIFITDKMAVQTIEFIREIFDRTKCGLVLCGTKAFEAELLAGKHKRLLRQLDLRSIRKLHLPDRPSNPDLEKFAAHYGLSPAKGEALTIQTEVIQVDGLGCWCSLLEDAAVEAAESRRRVTWDDVLQAASDRAQDNKPQKAN